MARKPEYGQLASNVTAAAGSTFYGAGQIMDWDLIAQIDHHAASMVIALVFLFTGGKTALDKFDDIRN